MQPPRTTTDGFSDRLVVTYLGPAHTVLNTDGSTEWRSTMPSLLTVLGADAMLEPADLGLTAGQIALLPAGTSFRIKPVDAGKTVNPVVVDIAFRSQGLDAPAVLPSNPVVIDGDDASELKDAVCSVSHGSNAEQDLTFECRQMAAGFRIIAALCEAVGLDPDRTRPYHEDATLRVLLQYLNNHYHQDLNIETIAGACHVSRRVLFKTTARNGVPTPMQLLKKIRLERSLILLQKPELSVTQVGFMVGFSEAQHFSKAFKKAYGMSPRQHRSRTVLNQQSTVLLERADTAFAAKHYERAVDLYQRVMASAPDWGGINRVYYQLGLAYGYTGKQQARDELWRKITSLQVQLRCRLHNCEYNFSRGRYLEAAESLRDIYRLADDAMRETVARRLAQWMVHCADAGRFAVARTYCDFAREIAAEHPAIHGQLATTLYKLRDYRAIPHYCPTQPDLIAAALRATGMYRAHLAQFPDMRRQAARIHLHMGHTETVLNEYSEFPGVCAQALCYARRFEEVVKDYPDYDAPALLVLGRYQEVLDRHHGDDKACRWALFLTGRTDEAMTRHDAAQPVPAELLFALGTVNDIVPSPLYGEEDKRAAIMMQAIQLLREGRERAGLNALQTIKRVKGPDYRPLVAFYLPELLIPLIRNSLSDLQAEMPDSDWRDWREDYLPFLKEDRRYFYVQKLWYDIRFVLGEIKDAAYLEQPNRLTASDDLLFIKAVRAEFRSEPERAAKYYRKFLERTAHNCSALFYYRWYLPVQTAFIRWRLEALD